MRLNKLNNDWTLDFEFDIIHADFNKTELKCYSCKAMMSLSSWDRKLLSVLLMYQCCSVRMSSWD